MMKKDNRKTGEYNKLEDAIFVHRLRHGLTAIKWSLKMLLSGDFGAVSDEQKPIIEKSLEEDEKMIVLANGLLSESGAQKAVNFLTKDLCDIEPIINTVLKVYEARIAEKKIEIKFIKSQEKTEAFLDKEKIRIVVQNILDNAIKYTPAGGKITISLDKNQNNLELKIKDSGMGIPENQKNKLFTKFFRSEKAIEINGDGSGLGLFIAKNIVDAHGGKIWFESKENEGTTFYIVLPVKPVDF